MAERPPEDFADEHGTPEAMARGASSLWSQNIAKRFAAGVPALIVVLLVIAVTPLFVPALIVAAAGVYGTYEYVRLLNPEAQARLPLVPMLLAGGAIGLGGLLGSAASLNGGLLVGVLLMVWTVWFAQPAGNREGPRDGLRDLGVAVAGLLLVPWLLNHLTLLVYLPGGRGFLAFVLVVVTLNDTLAYLVGTFFGNWPLMPSVSPNKTVEGAVGGVAGGAVAGVLARFWMGGEPVAVSLLALILLGGLLAVAGQAGDLLESKLKRLTHADDSGSFLPGHGGLLDRGDAYLLTAPLAYYLLLFLSG